MSSCHVTSYELLFRCRQIRTNTFLDLIKLQTVKPRPSWMGNSEILTKSDCDFWLKNSWSWSRLEFLRINETRWSQFQIAVMTSGDSGGSMSWTRYSSGKWMSASHPWVWWTKTKIIEAKLPSCDRLPSANVNDSMWLNISVTKCYKSWLRLYWWFRFPSAGDTPAVFLTDVDAALWGHKWLCQRRRNHEIQKHHRANSSHPQISNIVQIITPLEGMRDQWSAPEKKLKNQNNDSSRSDSSLWCFIWWRSLTHPILKPETCWTTTTRLCRLCLCLWIVVIHDYDSESMSMSL